MSWLKLYANNKLLPLVELSNTCNASCPQCNRFKPGTLEVHNFIKRKIWSLDEFRKAFPPNVLSHFERICFSGLYGEPTTCKDLLSIVEYVMSNSTSSVDITTNGSTGTVEWWTRLGEITGSRIFLQFDVDGIDQEMHSKYRRNTKLDSVLRNMKAFSSANKSGVISVLTVVFEHNENYLEEIKSLTKSCGANNWDQIESSRFFEEQNSTYKFVDSKGVEHELKQSSTRLLSQVPHARKTRNFRIESKEYSDESHEIICSAEQFGRLQLDSNGNILPCCWIQTALDSGENDEHTKRLKLLRESGVLNVFKNDFETVLNSSWLNGELQNSIKKISTASPVCIKWCGRKKNQKLDDPTGL